MRKRRGKKCPPQEFSKDQAHETLELDLWFWIRVGALTPQRLPAPQVWHGVNAHQTETSCGLAGAHAPPGLSSLNSYVETLAPHPTALLAEENQAMEVEPHQCTTLSNKSSAEFQ